MMRRTATMTTLDCALVPIITTHRRSMGTIVTTRPYDDAQTEMLEEEGE